MTDGKISFEAERGRFLDRVASDPTATSQALRAAIMISRYMNRDSGTAWPSFDGLSKAYGIDRRGIIRGIERLIEGGHIRVRRGAGRNSNTYEWTLKPAPDEVRSSVISTTATDPACGDISTTTNEGRANRSGGRDCSVAVVEIARSSVISTTRTSYEPLIEPSRDRAGLQPVPVPEDGACFEVGGISSASERQYGHNPFDDGDREDAPPVARRAGDAPIASDEEEDLSWMNEIDDEDASFGRYRGAYNGVCPTLEQLEAFVAEEGGEVTEDDRRECAEAAAENLEMQCSALRAGRTCDHNGDVIEVPPSDRTAIGMVTSEIRRAAYVGSFCNNADPYGPGKPQRDLWSRATYDLRRSFARDGIDPAISESHIRTLSSEVSEELRRREGEKIRKIREGGR